MMTKKIITQVQEYLTVVGDDRVYQIVNVEMLLRRHSGVAVIAFLNQLRSEYQKELGRIMKKENKTDPKINELVAKNFRLRMAINTIKNAREVRQSA
jgi:hypothetical protein